MRWTIAAAMVMLAACGDGQDKAPPAPDAKSATMVPSDAAPGDDKEAMARWEEDRGYEPDPAEKPVTAPAVDIGTGDQTIPAAIRGRWGLVPADCTSTRGDAKGLLTIDATSLRFYESHGSLVRIRERDADRIVADYRFSGEGQEWDRLMLLDSQDGGKALIRRDYGEGAAPGAMRYTRCAA